MINLNLIGGLGNQMFEYAYARALSQKFKDEEIVINSGFNAVYFLAASKKWTRIPNSLKHFKLNDNVREISGKGTLFKNVVSIISYSRDVFYNQKKGLSRNIYRRKSEKGIYQNPLYGFTYFPCAESSKKNKRITGLFQNEKYFKDIKGILLEEFEIKTEASLDNQIKMRELDNCNSVCVHIRRGDYLSPQYSFLNVCGEKYYQRAMDYIEKHLDEPVFYIFSNNSSEIAWIKEHYHFRQPVHYIDLNNPDYEELRLMSHCKHFILSNSTFSWWGSYLSENAGGGKIVIAPSVWQKDEYCGGEIDIYREEMIKIDVD